MHSSSVHIQSLGFVHMIPLLKLKKFATHKDTAKLRSIQRQEQCENKHIRANVSISSPSFVLSPEHCAEIEAAKSSNPNLIPFYFFKYKHGLISKYPSSATKSSNSVPCDTKIISPAR